MTVTSASTCLGDGHLHEKSKIACATTAWSTLSSVLFSLPHRRNTITPSLLVHFVSLKATDLGTMTQELISVMLLN
jgi:hypothetical protein